MNLIDKVKDFKNKKILVVGDIMIDHYIEGSVSRICPEAPVPIMDEEDYYEALGGAGNVAKYLSDLGAKVYLYGQVGADRGIEIIKFECDQSNLNYIGEVCEDYSTTIKNRAISKDTGQIVFRWDKEEIKPLNDFDESILEETLGMVDAVVISDYGKGVVTPEISKFIIQRHNKVIVDPKSGPWDHFWGAYIIKPNRKEFFDVMKIDASQEIHVAPAGINNTNFIVTLGELGMRVFSQVPFGVIDVPTETKEVIDVTGAGDMVASVLALSAATDMSLVDSATIANVAAGIKVSQHGTGEISLDWLLNELVEKDKEDRIFDLIKDQYEFIKLTRGKKVVFTNGCFDLIHKGHIELLKKAKAEGDFLVVGLNSDDSIKRLKGETRPIQTEEVRSTVLASIKYVDAVIVFNEDTPLELIKTIEPDVLVKGSDYSVHEIVGAKEVIESGGKVVTVELLEGCSTSSIVEKIKGK